MEVQDCTPKWKKYIPDYVSLYNVGYDDDLSNHMELIQACLMKNSLQPLAEEVYDFWDYPEGYYMEEIRRNMCEDGLLDEFEENETQIFEALCEADESNPVIDLVDKTSGFAVYYSLGKCVYEYDDPEENQALICKFLGIKKGSENAKKIANIISESPYGGELRIYFPMENARYYITDGEDDFNSIQFDGKFNVAVYNSTVGAGWYDEVELELTLPFVRENLIISKLEHYSLEECFGHYDNWCDDVDAPSCSYQKPVRLKIKKSESMDNIVYQNKLKETFQNGGCTFGDMDISRHRDVEYINEFPCGLKCPHCGTFWID